MGKVAIVLHGGAGPDSEFLRKNIQEYEEVLHTALMKGYEFLKKGGSALEAVELVNIILEDNPLFNAGRGSALNNKGEVDMNASIMSGHDLSAGAVAMIKNVKNPISLAKAVMQHTRHLFIAGKGAIDFAKSIGAPMRPDSYFIVQHRYDDFVKHNEEESEYDLLQKRPHGTIGCVALDYNGNLAAGTSTGGLTNGLEGRIGDSCIIGAGCFADNRTCAVSGTGDGELLIRGTVAHTISTLMEFSDFSIQEACETTVFQRCKNLVGDIGVIALDPEGNIGMAFNTARMSRAWITEGEEPQVRIYADEK